MMRIRKLDERRGRAWQRKEGGHDEKKWEKGKGYIPDDFVRLLREAYKENLIEQVHMGSIEMARVACELI